jgi:hypothetical protein
MIMLPLVLVLRMIFSENRRPLFRIMRALSRNVSPAAIAG